MCTGADIHPKPKTQAQKNGAFHKRGRRRFLNDQHHPCQEANRRNPTGGTNASSSASTASIIRSTSGAFITVAQGIPAMAIIVSPLARSNNRATILPGASMLASNPMGWKCQRINWQALGNVTLLKDPLFMCCPPSSIERFLLLMSGRKSHHGSTSEN